MKILVTGGAGYIGGCLVDMLGEDGHDITVYDSLVYEDRYLKDVDFVYGDVRDKDKLLKILPNYDAVVWLAAIVGDGACAVDPFLSQTVNEDSVKWLVDNYEGKIIFPSTCSVYGENNDLLHEESSTNPLSVYAVTKLAAEKYIVNNARKYLIFRLGTLFGQGDDHSRVRFDLVVNTLTRAAALDKAITIYGGDQWRPLLHVQDSAMAIDFGIRHKICGVYNLSSKNYKICDLATMIKMVIPDIEVRYQEMKFEDARNYKVSPDKYLKHGWKSVYMVEDGIREIYKLIKENRLKDVRSNQYSNVDFLGANK